MYCNSFVIDAFEMMDLAARQPFWLPTEAIADIHQYKSSFKKPLPFSTAITHLELPRKLFHDPDVYNVGTLDPPHPDLPFLAFPSFLRKNLNNDRQTLCSPTSLGGSSATKSARAQTINVESQGNSPDLPITSERFPYPAQILGPKDKLEHRCSKPETHKERKSSVHLVFVLATLGDKENNGSAKGIARS